MNKLFWKPQLEIYCVCVCFCWPCVCVCVFLLALCVCVSDLSESDGHPCDGVVVRAPLQGGEHGEVDFVLQVIHHLAALLIHRAHAFAVED